MKVIHPDVRIWHCELLSQCPCAVSYTHLDVYKRQVFLLISTHFTATLGIPLTPPTLSVSYTHLDVYKRQEEGWCSRIKFLQRIDAV